MPYLEGVPLPQRSDPYRGPTRQVQAPQQVILDLQSEGCMENLMDFFFAPQKMAGCYKNKKKWHDINSGKLFLG